ncbi:Substance-K receptor [Amphibalanus amphitrite]|uniref:Substance-K receptor n=1 Tax=Amphibalanus amphitrite TaxID=1232801 RepID=A0A6A4WAA0_AMPAM|nr:Substance-K receptor [Amphibalanus amphitrite]
MLDPVQSRHAMDPDLKGSECLNFSTDIFGNYNFSENDMPPLPALETGHVIKVLTALTASVLTLTAIACDRFVAVMFPLRARRSQTGRRVGIIIAGIWVVSMAAALPLLIHRHLLEIQVAVALFFAPIAVMGGAYTLIVWRLWLSPFPSQGMESQIHQSNGSKKRVVKMVVLVMVVFV